MPRDALSYALCAQELNKKLVDGKINKISMPSPDTVFLSIRAGGQNHSLLLSANPTYPRLHLTNTSMQNPLAAPAFLMHLRKHIGSGVIESICETPYERIITITIRTFNELLVTESKRLIIEIMGKHSNIILVNSNGIISDCIKHITHEISSKRQVLAGLPYQPAPKQINKINASQNEELCEALRSYNADQPLDKYLQGILYGLAPISIKEVIYRTFDGQTIPTNKLTDHQIKGIICNINSLYDFSRANPCALKANDSIQDFFVLPYLSVIKEDTASSSYIYYDSINQAIDAFYSSLSTSRSDYGRRGVLITLIKNTLNKNQKKLGLLMQKQADSSDCEEDRKKADLIISNFYKIRKGDSEIEVEDFYNDNSLLRITIDPHKSPQANAQSYYKSYNKKKTALLRTEELLQKLTESIEYLEDALYFAESAKADSDITMLFDELTTLGYLKKKTSSKKEKPKNKQTQNAISFQGHKISIGKSSLHNDELVRNSAPTFVWLHASGIHGSHVIIENFSDVLPKNEVLIFAAQLAAYHSKARLSENVPVDYTFIKHVKKPRGAVAGRVVFSNQKTLFVSPKTV